MPLSEAQLEAAKQFLISRSGGTMVCPVCAHTIFHISPLLVVTPSLGVGDDPVTAMRPSSGTPMLELICVNCGYLRHFSAILLGLFPKHATGDIL